jgi:alkylation response protein AidB-like acyl-CoA dehydrogenase
MFMDARVFTIFDGTNDLLSQQLAQHCQQLQGAEPSVHSSPSGL